MKISEIYDFEENRQYNSDKYLIRFIREGNWWRAYEWSAYLAHNFPNSLDDKNRLSVTKKHYVELNKDLVVVGLQIKSFGKYLPGITTSESAFTINDGYIDVDASEYFVGHEIKCDDCKVLLNSWKNKIELSEKKKKGGTEATSNDNGKNTNEIARLLNDINDYQLANKTMVENTVFLNGIQERIKKILNR